MPFRDITFLLIWLYLIPVSLVRPCIGILAWYWIAFFVPHGLTWGFARELPVAIAIGGATLVGFLLTKDKKPLPRCAVTFFMLACVVHFTLTTILAHNRGLSYGKWEWVSKVLLMTFVTMSLFQDRARLRSVYMVAALGLGFYGFKGGIWVLVKGGGELVLGPEKSFFGDNNTLGLALCMILPILLYLSREEERPWLKWLLRITFSLSMISIIFTYSRGAFLGLLIILSVLIWRSPWRMRFAVAILLVALVGAPLAPERLWNRLGSITQQESAETRDRSSAARLEAWQTAWSIALSHPLTGAGFRALDNADLWLLHYGQDYMATSDAHSIYFELLEEHGFLGFGLYFAALISALLTLRRIRKRWRKHPEHGYLSHYAEMLQLSFCPFLVSGAFLGVAYFDLYFMLLGTVAVLHELSRVAEAAVVSQAPATDSPPAALRLRKRAVPVRSQSAVPIRPRRRPRHA
jgi:probable O-glycosylation ligase (exosortase A-associated)